MSDPKRWLDGAADAPNGAADLLRSATAAPPVMSNAVRATTAAFATKTAAGVAAGAASAGIATKLLAIAVVTGIGASGVAVKNAYEARNARESAQHAAVSHIAKAMPRVEETPPIIPVAPSPAPSVEEVVAQSATRTARVIVPVVRSEPASVAPVVENVDALAEEGRLLETARRSLASSPEEALARIDEHSHRFAHGELRAERELLAIDALVRLNRGDEARARASNLREHDARGLYAQRVERLLSRLSTP